MIKVGIIGADKPEAGELLRLLLNHPEVDVMALYAPSLTGRQISSCHHGFIGERIMTFTDRINLSGLDAVYIVDNSIAAQELKQQALELDELRVIDMSPNRFDDWTTTEMEYGLSEINRKSLVRGARMAIIPTPVASIALIALYPLATHLLLPSELSLKVSVPEDFIKEFDINATVAEISRQLNHTQKSFEGKVAVKVVPESKGRAIRIVATMPCSLGIAEIDKIYDSIYDDHNFTFTSLSKVGSEEVEGTQKCVVSFCKPGAGLLEIDAVGDCYLRGGAGDAVHVLNLLFTLQEKVGLNLKPSRFCEHNVTSSRQTSWFA